MLGGTENLVTLDDQMVRLLSYIDIDNVQLDSLFAMAKTQLSWSDIFAISIFHKTHLLLERQLQPLIDKGVEFRGLNAELLSDFQEKVFQDQQALQLQQSEFTALLATLDSEGIPTILIKGLALEASAYRRTRTRPYRDCDLIVEEEHFEAIHNVLNSFGYIQGGYDANSGKLIPATEQYINARRRNKRHLQGYHKLSPADLGGITFEIEVHGPRNDETFLNRDTSVFFGRAENGKQFGLPGLLLCPVDNIIYLAAHLYQHAYHLASARYLSSIKLIHLCDLREVIKSTNFTTWEQLWEMARNLNAVDAVYYSLFHMNQLFPDVLPQEALEPSPDGLTKSREAVIDDRWEFIGGSSLFVERLFHPTIDIDRLVELKSKKLAGGHLEIPFTPSPPKIDGCLDDACWQKLSFEEISGAGKPPSWQYFRSQVAYGKKPESDADISCKFAMGWADDVLFFAAEVKDDVLVFNQLQGYYQLQDCLQLLIEAPLGSKNVANIFLVPKAEDIDRPSAMLYLSRSQRGTQNIDESEVSVTYRDDGYIIEAAIPLRSLGIAIEEGELFGLDVVVYDTDSEIEERKTILAWSGGRNAVRNPAVFGTACLSRN